MISSVSCLLNQVPQYLLCLNPVLSLSQRLESSFPVSRHPSLCALYQQIMILLDCLTDSTKTFCPHKILVQRYHTGSSALWQIHGDCGTRDPRLSAMLTLALCSGIAPGISQWTLYSVGDQILVVWVKGILPFVLSYGPLNLIFVSTPNLPS